MAATIEQHQQPALVQHVAGMGPDTSDRVYAVLAAPAGDRRGTRAAALELAERLRLYGIVAVSGFHSDPGQLPCAVREADPVLAALRELGGLEEREMCGTYRLLFRMLAAHPEGLDAFYDSSLGPLPEHDDRYRTDLIPTLDSYLEENCNINAVARAMFAHRHTIAHRLERIRALTGLDPTRSDDRERLGLALKVRRLVGARRAS